MSSTCLKVKSTPLKRSREATAPHQKMLFSCIEGDLECLEGRVEFFQHGVNHLQDYYFIQRYRPQIREHGSHQNEARERRASRRSAYLRRSPDLYGECNLATFTQIDLLHGASVRHIPPVKIFLYVVPAYCCRLDN